MPTPTTEQVIAEIEAVLTRRLGLASPRFRLECRGGRVSGLVTSQTFFGLRDHARQAMIWDALDAEYGRESVRRVGSLLAFSPTEWDLEDVPPAVARRHGRHHPFRAGGERRLSPSPLPPDDSHPRRQPVPHKLPHRAADLPRSTVTTYGESVLSPVSPPNPRGSRDLLCGDVLLCFGKQMTLQTLVPRPEANKRKGRTD